MTKSENRLGSLLEALVKFRDERDWAQFHTLKNLSAALSVETSELLELTQWDTNEQAEKKLLSTDFRSKVEGEIADVFIYLLLISKAVGANPIELAERKLRQNAARYPVEKSHGNSKKYTEME